MNLLDIVRRPSPAAWEDAEKIPWNDPDFSRRMLESHLSQDHDWASRRHEIIDAHVRWISDRLPNKNARILDLGCGPGFYTQRLAELGFSCTGVDFSPASIEYAREQAVHASLKIEYVSEDIRRFQTDQTFDCVMLTFGEFNVFKECDALTILRNASARLHDEGFLLLETHTYEAVKEIGRTPSSWQIAESGVFTGLPHLHLQENFWDESTATATTRYFIIDAETAFVREYGSSMKAYSDREYVNLLQSAGFTAMELLNSDTWPNGTDFEGKLQTFVCRKR